MRPSNVKTFPISRVILFLMVVTFSNNPCLSQNNVSSASQHDIDFFQTHEVNYVWTIDQLYFRVRGGTTDNYSIESPTFSATTDGRLKWYLRLEPYKGYDGKNFNLYVRLSPLSKKLLAWIMPRLDIWSDEGRTVSLWNWKFSDDTLRCITANTIGWGVTDVHKTEEMLSRDKIIISCKMKYCEEPPYLSHFRETTTTIRHQSNTSDSNFFDYSAPLFNNSKFADIVLIVNGTRYPAHKTILAARSPLFAQKLERGAKKGKIMKRMNIANMNEQVAGEMLRYIYTGKCENLSNIASQLLVAANKYGLNELKMNCAETLYKNLTVSNVVKTLMLAQKQGIADLKEKTIAFISAKYTEISNTTEWNRIVKKNPQFVHDVVLFSRNLKPQA